MIIRLATLDELPELAQELPEMTELTLGRVWVGVEEGVVVGVLPLRLCWQAEPMLLLKKSAKLKKITRSRCALLLYLAAEEFIRSSANRSGPKWLFAITYSNSVRRWADRLLWKRIYRGASMYVKYLR